MYDEGDAPSSIGESPLKFRIYETPLFALPVCFRTKSMKYHTTDRDGITELSPPAERLREIIESVNEPDAGDEASPEVWLSHTSGWTLSYFPSGLMLLENDHSQSEPRALPGVGASLALTLWQLLANDQITELRRFPWEPYETEE